jgi:predicted amidophosphoribosyltransferase
MDSGLFDGLAGLAAHSVNAPAALFYARNIVTGHVKVLGRFGTLYEPPPKTPMPCFLNYDFGFAAICDVPNDPRMVGHPLLDMTPQPQTLLIARVSPEQEKDQNIKFAIIVFNAPSDVLNSNNGLSSFSRVIGVCRQFDHALEGRQIDVSDLAEKVPSVAPAQASLPARVDDKTGFADPASRFLFQTLAKKHALHERNGASFVTLRAWRKAIKEHQIEALVALKHEPPPRFVELVADEMYERARILFGPKAIRSVVPVPGGSSGATASLSVRLAEKLAHKLGATYVEALENGAATAKGRSHPKKSALLKPYEVLQKPKGTALLVDDVVTSGRHIELALAALRGQGVACFALSWIGP